MDKHSRLKMARVRAGFTSAAEAARALGVREVTYSSHENGYRQYDDHRAKAYARRFRVSPVWLLFGTGEMDAPIPPASDLSSKQAELIRMTDALDSDTLDALLSIIERMVDQSARKGRGLRADRPQEDETSGP